MTAIETLRNGNVQQAFEELKNEVRSAPDRAEHRVFLFQLLAVLGRWDRALTQLNVIRDLDVAALPMVQTYQETLQCEALRAQVFAGRTTPVVFGEPEPWIAWLQESLRHLAEGRSQQAVALRERAFEAAPATPGRIMTRAAATGSDGDATGSPAAVADSVERADGESDAASGERFQWLADADPRLGPVLEAIINGRYYWVPLHRIRRIDVEAPADLRDVVWMPAHFEWSNGGETVGLIPTRYPGSESHTDDQIVLGRKTDWEETVSGFQGWGQRVLATDQGEYALMDIRRIELEPTSDDSSEDSGVDPSTTTPAD